jgi:hypothetical protein
MRDFIYGKSDVLVALLIVAIAGTVIFTRVNAIMEYPSRVAAETEAQAAEDADDAEAEGLADIEGQTDASTTDAGGEALVDSSASAGQNQQSDQNAQSSTPATTGNPVSFAVASGEATSVIADNLVKAGLVSSRQVFLDAVTAKGAETRLRAGTFNIPPGSTPDQIVDILIS